MLQIRKGFPAPELINVREWVEITPADAKQLFRSRKDILIEGFRPRYWEYPDEVAWIVRVEGVMTYHPSTYIEEEDALTTPFDRDDIIWRYFKKTKAR